MGKTIKVITCVNKEVSVQEIKNDLKTMQEIVGGYITTARINDTPFDRHLIICDEDGEPKQLEPSVQLGNHTFFGNFIIATTTVDGSEFDSISDDAIEEVLIEVQESIIK